MCQGQRLAGDERIPGVFTARVTLARRMEAAVIRWAGHKGHSPLDCSSSPGWDAGSGTEVPLPVVGFQYSRVLL